MKDSVRSGEKQRNEGPSAGWSARTALRFAEFADRWFPDAFIFVALSVAITAASGLLNGAAPQGFANAFGDGFL